MRVAADGSDTHSEESGVRHRYQMSLGFVHLLHSTSVANKSKNG